jgi:hypothetical protein
MSVSIYDVTGKLVWSHPPKADRTSLVWDAPDQPKGIYLVRAEVGNRILEDKVILIR